MIFKPVCGGITFNSMTSRVRWVYLQAVHGGNVQTRSWTHHRHPEENNSILVKSNNTKNSVSLFLIRQRKIIKLYNKIKIVTNMFRCQTWGLFSNRVCFVLLETNIHYHMSKKCWPLLQSMVQLNSCYYLQQSFNQLL